MVYTFFSVFASLFLMPLRLLHPLLRVAGLKNHFLPIDIIQKHYCRGFLYLCGVTVRWEGIDHLVSNTTSLTYRQYCCDSKADKYAVLSLLSPERTTSSRWLACFLTRATWIL